MFAFATRLYRYFATRPLLADFLLAAIVCAFAVFGAAPSDVTGSRDPGPLTYLLAVLCAAPIALRRRYPLAVLAVVSASFSLFLAFGFKSSLATLGVLISVYTVAVRHELRDSARFTAAMLAVVLTGAAIGLRASPLVNVVYGVVQVVTAMAVGQVVRSRMTNVAQLAERAERLARERELEAGRAVAEERIRIARELHDVVSHHLSVISVQASLARYVFESDPDTARHALGTITATTTESLDELRRLLRVLRPPKNDLPEHDWPQDALPVDGSGQAGFSPQPGLTDLTALAERVRDAGVALRFEVTGSPRPLSPGQALCAYRVAQEALTNVLKHAARSTAVLGLDYRQDGLALRVSDTGGGVPAEPNPGGHGLIGMRERAAMYGGSVRSGPLPSGGFRTELWLPYPHGGEAVEPRSAPNDQRAGGR